MDINNVTSALNELQKTYGNIKVFVDGLPCDKITFHVNYEDNNGNDLGTVVNLT